MPQNFYQRALSGDADEIISNPRRFMQHKSLAAYCDAVLPPALHLTFFDLWDKIIGPAEKERVTGVIIPVIETLSGTLSAMRGSENPMSKHRRIGAF